jgi:hypothetical protein
VVDLNIDIAMLTIIGPIKISAVLYSFESTYSSGKYF